MNMFYETTLQQNNELLQIKKHMSKNSCHVGKENIQIFQISSSFSLIHEIVF